MPVVSFETRPAVAPQDEVERVAYAFNRGITRMAFSLSIALRSAALNL